MSESMQEVSGDPVKVASDQAFRKGDKFDTHLQ